MKYIDGVFANPNYHPENRQLKKWIKSLKSLAHIDEIGNVSLLVVDRKNPSRSYVAIDELPHEVDPFYADFVNDGMLVL